MERHIRFGSVCSGIEAASVAWSPLCWETAFVAEIDPFASAVLTHNFPEVPNRGDFTKIEDGESNIDVLVGGTPCQSFSVAGLRKGMDDDRGNLALEFLRLAGRLRPRWVVWENVPGILSSGKGRDFGSFLGGLVELGYGFAYRILDAQYVRVDGFGRAVPQRRRRVFVVGCLGDWRRAAAVLFERESLSGNPSPRREAGADVANALTRGLGSDGPDDTKAQANHLIGTFQNTGQGYWNESDSAQTLRAAPGASVYEANAVAHTLRADGFDASEDGTGRGTPIVPVAVDLRNGTVTGDVALTLQSHHKSYSLNASPLVMEPVAYQCHGNNVGSMGTIRSGNGGLTGGVPFIPVDQAIAFQERGRDGGRNLEYQEELSYALRAIDGGGCGDWFRIATRWAVRRLTPLECERLQGFPDGWTDVPYRGKAAKDGPRYKAIGNSMAVNCMRWIGRRIDMLESLNSIE